MHRFNGQERYLNSNNTASIMIELCTKSWVKIERWEVYIHFPGEVCIREIIFGSGYDLIGGQGMWGHPGTERTA